VLGVQGQDVGDSRRVSDRERCAAQPDRTAGGAKAPSSTVCPCLLRRTNRIKNVRLNDVLQIISECKCLLYTAVETNWLAIHRASAFILINSDRLTSLALICSSDRLTSPPLICSSKSLFFNGSALGTGDWFSARMLNLRYVADLVGQREVA
jgi:hypothetical protein